MADFVFKLPDVGEGTAEAEIVAWHVAVGDLIEEDQPLVDVMTDKATVEMTTPVSGRVVALNGELGDMAAVGSALAVIAVDGAETVEAKSAPAEAAPQPAVAAAPAPAPKSTASAAPKAPRSAPVARVPDEKPLASPAVRRRAHELGIALQFVPGTGPAGRISEGDL